MGIFYHCKSDDSMGRAAQVPLSERVGDGGPSDVELPPVEFLSASPPGKVLSSLDGEIEAAGACPVAVDELDEADMFRFVVCAVRLIA
jgi:hypothetical protein